MASAANSSQSVDSPQPFEFETSFKALADSSRLKPLPSNFNSNDDSTAPPSSHSISFPIVDFSALVAADPKAVHDLAAACQEWGFFILVNHGISETLMDAAFAAATEFFDLPDFEKKQYEVKSASDPIKCGNFNFNDINTTSSNSNQSFTL